jgi:hypothetical protein
VTVTDIIKYYYKKKDDNYLAEAMIRYGKYWGRIENDKCRRILTLLNYDT